MEASTGTKYRAVFISDLHLGSKHCNSDALLEFLTNINTEKLFLVGDIIDGWRLQKKWFWPNKHNRILQKILKISKDIEVVYITGNHDEFLRALPGMSFGNISIENRVSYLGLDGKKYLVTHGDIFDNLMRTKSGRFIMYLGDFAYDGLLYINRLVIGLRKLFNLPPWSLAKYLKRKAKAASNYINHFSLEISKYCKRKGYDGVICGHIHHAEIVEYDGIKYMNDGDWCESCTALVETQDGEWKIINRQ